VIRDLPHNPQRFVEIAVDGDDFRAVHDRLGQFAHGDFAVGYDDDGPQSGHSGICGGRGRGIPGGGADNAGAAFFHRFGHRHHHPPVFERTGGVQPFKLQIQFDAQLLGQTLGRIQRRIAFKQREPGRPVGNRQKFRKRLDNSSPLRQLNFLLQPGSGCGFPG